MNDAPERVWIDHDDWDWYDTKPERPATEYVRADIAEARIRELDEECNLHVTDLHETAAEMFRYRGALEEIDNLPSHRNPCCPTNPAKSIARRALNQETTDE